MPMLWPPQALIHGDGNPHPPGPRKELTATTALVSDSQSTGKVAMQRSFRKVLAVLRWKNEREDDRSDTADGYAFGAAVGSASRYQSDDEEQSATAHQQPSKAPKVANGSGQQTTTEVMLA